MMSAKPKTTSVKTTAMKVRTSALKVTKRPATKSGGQPGKKTKSEQVGHCCAVSRYLWRLKSFRWRATTQQVGHDKPHKHVASSMTRGIDSGSRPKTGAEDPAAAGGPGRCHRVGYLRFNADEDEAPTKWVAERPSVPDQRDSFGKKPNT